MKPILACTATIVISFALSTPMLAACHAVSPAGGGSKNGSDWNDPYAGLPSTLVRGDTYYLADGNYGSYTMATAASGSTTITVKKATAADFGQSCTTSIGAGWNVGTMGSSSATFTQWEDSTSGGYYTVNGVFGSFNSTELPTSGGFGIYMNGTNCAMGSLGRCVEIDLPGAKNVTFSFVEVQGTGATEAANTNTPDDLLYYGGSSNLTIDHAYLHDSSCDFTFGYGATSLTVQYSYFYKNWGTGSCHGQGSWNGSTVTGAVWRYNTMRTIEGSAIWTAATAGGGTTLSNWQIYGNTIYFGGVADKSDYQCLGDGVFACLNSGVTCTNIQFYNNTIVNLQTNGFASCGAGAAGIYGDPASSSSSTYIVRNNLWYGNKGSVGFGPNGSFVEDHNSYLSNPGGSSSGTADVTNSSASNPFVVWTGSGNLDARLSADTSDVNNWFSLPSPFNVDPNGVTRTTDRGAYQYGGQVITQGSPPNPPTQLTALAK